LGGSGGAGGSGPSNGGANVLQYHKNLSRDGLYVDAAFTKAAAAKIHRDAAFNATIQGPTFAQPLYFEGAAGGKNVVIVATVQNRVYALDAATGAAVWQKQVAMPDTGTFGCGTNPTVGIIGTPVIDAGSKTVFFDAGQTGPTRRIHALSLDDGSERAGWPVDVTKLPSFDPRIHNQRSALSLLGGTLYVPYGGFVGDCGNYHGWVVGISISDPSQVKSFATAALKSGIWGPGGLASDGTSLFVTTGNAPRGTMAWGQQEAVLRLQAGPVFLEQPVNFFYPSDWSTDLDANDRDLGGSGPILVDVPGATPSQLVVALGKNGVIYLLNRANLGGTGKGNGVTGEGVTSNRASSSTIITAAGAYTTAQATYVVFRGAGINCPGGQTGDLVAVKISAANPPAPTVAWCARQNGAGSPMVTTTDGHAEAIVWGLGATSSNRLMAFDGDTGAVIFNGGAAGDVMTATSKWITPIVARGRIYVAADNNVYAFTMQ